MHLNTQLASAVVLPIWVAPSNILIVLFASAVPLPVVWFVLF